MLVLENVSKTYRPGERPALQSASLRLERGELVALLGPSGAGKSTLLRCINGLVQPDSGTVHVDGQEVTGLRGAALQAARRKVAIIFQEFHLIDRLNVITNVISGRFGTYSFWRNVFKMWDPADLAEARRLLNRVGLSGLDRSLARELSGGQRQRVAIARAMMQQPLMLLGDEPVASLDPVTARSIMELIADLSREQGLTTVLSLHDVTLAREFCQRAIGVSQGRLVYDGPMNGVTEATLRQIYAGEVIGPQEHTAAADLTSLEIALEKGCGRK